MKKTMYEVNWIGTKAGKVGKKRNFQTLESALEWANKNVNSSVFTILVYMFTDQWILMDVEIYDKVVMP